MTVHTLVNSYIRKNKIQCGELPSHYITSNNTRRSYYPVSFSANSDPNRKEKDFSKDNRKPEDWKLLWVATHIRHQLGLHLDHIVPVSKKGNHHVSNLRILPKALNSAIGNLGLSNEELNEFINCLTPNLRKKFGIPEEFRACSLEEFCKEYHNWF